MAVTDTLRELREQVEQNLSEMKDTAALDALNKYFGIAQMPTAGSTYWNMVHGLTAEDAPKDEEGMQTMRNLARNMAWMLKCFEAGKASGVSLPAIERGSRTNFIR